MLKSLEYPFDIATIFRKKRAIKKDLLMTGQKQAINIAILGGSTTSEVKNIFELFLLKSGFVPSFYESEYNKYYEDALFGHRELAKFRPDIIYIHTTNLNINSYPSFDQCEEDVEAILMEEIDKFKSIWSSLTKYNCSIIQNNFDLPANRNLGNLEAYALTGKIHFIQRLNMEFAKNARTINNLYINDINYLSADIGLQRWFDKSIWHRSKYAINFDAIPLLVHNLTNIICAIYGRSKKGLVLDLDNTCWGGVIGDDGINGIKLGTESAIGESFSAFQTYVRELKSRGILLSICSKNELINAKDGFTHSSSILQYDDFVVFKANWEQKALNIQEIANEIGIGLDSLVFIDDNAAERHIVFSQLPEVSVPNVGDNPLNFINFLDRSGYFETISLSKDDINRNHFYKNNNRRISAQAQFAKYDDFLKSLHMIAEIRSFSDQYLDRITQLINKTNQFNLTTKRYTYGEIRSVWTDQTYIKLYGKLSDRFGDNGIITAIIALIEGKTCHIELWVMSCRVLKRNMEHAMLDALVEHCVLKGITHIIGCYLPSKKNDLVSNLYKEFGFSQFKQADGTYKWILNIENYIVKNEIIKIEL